MNTKRKIDQAMLAMANDPQLAAEFDQIRASQFPNKSRREAAELALAALEAKRNAGLAGERAKAMKHLATVAKDKFRSFISMGRTDLPTRPDKRQAPLALDQWSLQHLMQCANRGDTEAASELSRRGYELNSNKTFTKKA